MDIKKSVKIKKSVWTCYFSKIKGFSNRTKLDKLKYDHTVVKLMALK